MSVKTHLRLKVYLSGRLRLLLNGAHHGLDKANRMSTNPQARYVQGNILGHLIQAAAASSVGMLAIFLVDLADLYFISLLGVPQLAAAVGFSGMLFFLAASIGMALSVAASTLVSQALGQNNPEKASQYFLDVTVFALGSWHCCHPNFLHLCAPSLLSLLGARGEVHDMALNSFSHRQLQPAIAAVRDDQRRRLT